MTTINGTQESGNRGFKQIEDSRFGTHLPAIMGVAAMAAVLLLAISCAKKSGNSANTKIAAPTSAALATDTPAVAPAAMPQAVKKVKKHRPTNATYVNSAYGVSFSFPRKYSLQPSDKPDSSGPIQPGFLKPGAIQVASIDMPDDSYPDTDFSSALLNLSVNPGMTSEECGQFVPNPKDPDAAKPSSVKLGTNEFTEEEEIAGEETHQSDLKYFHLFKNGSCYEFALDVETSRKADEELAQVDRGKVFQQLEKILATARIKKIELRGIENEKVALTETTTPAAQPVTPIQK